MTEPRFSKRDEPQPPNPALPDGHRLLIVSDLPNQTELLEMIFKSRGWDVVKAISVAEVYGLLDPPPDCLIADLTLYLADGSSGEVVKAVRTRSPTVRIVLINDPREFFDEEVLRRVRAQGRGLPADGPASDAQYDAFFEACDQTRKRLLDEEVRPDVVLTVCISQEDIIRACEPKTASRPSFTSD